MRARSVVLVLGFASFAAGACGWDPSRPFDRNSPAVNEAIGALDSGDAKGAATTLEEYLATGACSEGSIGTPDLLHRRPNGSFDLGLSLFKIGEAFGRRFGEEELDAGNDEASRAQRTAQIACALRIVAAIASDDNVPLDVRARARYLEGNLDFLDGKYEEAVRAYDHALTLSPGENEAGDPVGRDAAWNRAIALRRIEDKKDAGQDAAPDAPQDAPQDSAKDSANDSGNDAGKDSGSDGGKDGSGDSGNDGSGEGGNGQPDAGQDAAEPPPSAPDAGPPPPPRANQDERILDQLENAPTVQQEAAKKLAGRRRVRGMADK